MQQFIGFKIRTSHYMLPIMKIREIITMPAVVALPHLPSYIRGITNLRGSIVPIVHLGSIVNASGDKGPENTVIVLSVGKIIFGIIVDGITGVINADESNMEAPDNFINSCSDNIAGVAKINNELIVLLDIKKLLPVDDMSLLEDAIFDMKQSDDGNSVEVSREIETIGGRVVVKELHNAKEYFSGKLGQDGARQRVYDLMLKFMDALSAGEYNNMENIITELGKETGSELFSEVGRITKKLNDSIKEFKGAVDSGLQKLTKDGVPNAVDKLQFVITKTEEAADKTMGIVERYFEESEDFNRNIANLTGDAESLNYLKTFKESLDNDMTVILTAQQFQDITGQTIKKVISLVNHVEAELLRLVTHFNLSAVVKPAEAVETDDTSNMEKVWSECEDNSTEKISQSDVEALLNNCGF